VPPPGGSRGPPGYDGGDAVISEYQPKGRGHQRQHITPVVFDVAYNGYIDVESHLAAAIARD
jgi:hypothetical protein